jgi:hypothetical protein
MKAEKNRTWETTAVLIAVVALVWLSIADQRGTKSSTTSAAAPGAASQDLCRLCAELSVRAAHEHRTIMTGRTQTIDDVMDYASDHDAEGQVNFYTRSFIRSWVSLGYDFAEMPDFTIAAEIKRGCLGAHYSVSAPDRNGGHPF